VGVRRKLGVTATGLKAQLRIVQRYEMKGLRIIDSGEPLKSFRSSLIRLGNHAGSASGAVTQTHVRPSQRRFDTRSRILETCAADFER
jgi:hypothetical protein